jgi:MSHA biogenesis protein MshL
MTTTKTTACIVLAALAGGCITPPPKEVDGRIMSELQQATAQRKSARPSAVDAALMPPLKMEMPASAGRPIDPRFDLSVNNAPATQVFMSLVAGTRYSMLIHPAVSGTISVSLKDVTLQEALDSIRDLYGYEHSIEGSRILIQPAGLQTRIFRVNYLTAQRRGSSDVRVQSGSVADVGGAAAPPGQPSPAAPVPGTLPGGQPLPVARSIDSSRVSTQQLNDFWADLRSAVQSIVGNGEGRNVVVTPNSGIVMVRAMPSELRSVELYLRETRISVERQVMLEAKIIQVTLSDAYQTGINWAIFRNSGPNVAAGQFSTARDTTQLTARGSQFPLISGGQAVDTAERIAIAASTTAAGANPASALFGVALQTSNFAALLQFLETQGSVQVLSSPRVATLNNQKAVLKVGTDEFFVTNVSTVTTTTGVTSQQTPTVTVAPFFSGILLDVTPRIDENDNIMLHIHPSISEVTESQRVVNLGGSVPSITLPLAKSTVSETDSIVRALNGNIVAIGGLMSVDTRDNRGGIPGLDIQILRNTDRQVVKRELVILLKPTVLQDDRAAEQDLRDIEERLRNFYPPAKGSR